MLIEETDTEESARSLSKKRNVLDNDLDGIHLESGSSDEEMSDDELDSEVWNEIESESDPEFTEDHGIVEEANSASEDNVFNPIDCYRHFITNEIIYLTVRETNRYAKQYLQAHRVSRRSKYLE